MQLILSGYETCALMDALETSLEKWDERILEAQAGKRPSMSIEGARLLQGDIHRIMDQVKQLENF